MAEKSLKLVAKAAAAIGSIKNELTKASAKGAVGLYGKTELQKAIAKLELIHSDLQTPCLRLAFVGTISSGKSTLLNALAGQEVAPTEAGEKSAGVLRIRNSENIGMRVLKTENMAWKSGAYKVGSVDEIYDKLRNPEKGIMAVYRRAVKENSKVKSPIIEVELPLAPKNGGTLNFKMPPNIDLELIDLPGLDAKTARANMDVIKNQLAGALLLVVLNYSETDNNKRDALLAEVKNTLDSAGHNKDAVIFILNRVDRRGANDYPLEKVLAKLSREVKEKLELRKTPKIIPMSALALYHLQTAWGTEKKPLFERGEAETTQKHLQDFDEDCAVTVAKMKQKYESFRDWWQKEEWQNIKSRGHKKDISQLLEWVYEESNGKIFWQTVQEKLDGKAAAVMVNPALAGTINTLEEFSQKLASILEKRKQGSVTEIQKLKERVDTLIAETKAKLQKVNNTGTFSDSKQIKQHLSHKGRGIKGKENKYGRQSV